jgi:hypothetical protein
MSMKSRKSTKPKFEKIKGSFRNNRGMDPQAHAGLFGHVVCNIADNRQFIVLPLVCLDHEDNPQDEHDDTHDYGQDIGDIAPPEDIP